MSNINDIQYHQYTMNCPTCNELHHHLYDQQVCYEREIKKLQIIIDNQEEQINNLKDVLEYMKAKLRIHL